MKPYSLIWAKHDSEENQTDVGASGVSIGQMPAVVGGVHVANFESRPLARQAAGSQRRQTALVGDFRQRIGLVHELRKLARAEEIGTPHHRLGVHQVVRMAVDISW